MEIIIKEGKDLEILINEICDELNITRDDFYYKYNEKKNGLFNKNSLITLKVILKKDLLEYIKSNLNELLSNMNIEANYESKIRENALYIKIYSNYNSALIGVHGSTLKALEVIVRQKIATEFDIQPIINLDVENYREKREKRLISMAKRLAKEVSKTKVEVHLENMNAYDRRIIHNALTNFKDVVTSSEGEEPNRHIVIKPV